MKDTFFLAPFRGITMKAYRHALHTHAGGFDGYYAPFISGSGTGRIHPSKLSDLPDRDQAPVKTIPQVISNDALEIILLGNTLYDQGYPEVNWNLGCPFARITNKKRGCGLLPYPDEVDRILEEVFTELKPSLSVKTRLGKNEAGEIRHILPILNRYPLKHIILHPRTGKQIYGGKANPLAFKEAISLSEHPLIYNGDIIHRTSFRQIQALLPGQTSWMIGRGALINPFLAREIRGISPGDEEKRGHLHAFHQALWDHAQRHIMPKSRQIGWLKAIWHYMSGIFSDSKLAFDPIKRAQNSRDYLAAVDKAMLLDFAGEKDIERHFLSLTK